MHLSLCQCFNAVSFIFRVVFKTMHQRVHGLWSPPTHQPENRACRWCETHTQACQLKKTRLNIPFFGCKFDCGDYQLSIDLLTQISRYLFTNARHNSSVAFAAQQHCRGRGNWGICIYVRAGSAICFPTCKFVAKCAEPSETK